MSTIPLLLQFPQAPGSPSPLHRPISRSPNALRQGGSIRSVKSNNNRNSFPPDQNQESRWASLLSRATSSTKPYGACIPTLTNISSNASFSNQPTLPPTQQPPLVHQLSPSMYQQPLTTYLSPISSSPKPPTTTYQPPTEVHQLRPAAQQAPGYSPLVPTAYFNRGVTSPTAIKLFNPSKRLNKSQSHLIMPRVKSFLRTGQGSRSGKDGSSNAKKETTNAPHDHLTREVSVKSLASYGDANSPEPLIRKCHTVLALSSTAGSGAHTRLVKEKNKKLGFLRRMSSSRSAVFSTNKMTLPKSPSVASEMRRLRKNSSSVLFTQTEIEDEGNGCSRCASAASIGSRRLSGLAQDTVFCKLCLSDFSIREMYQLQQCQCRFCKYCMAVYATLKIREGDYDIECPDADCDCNGELTLEEIESLVGNELLQLHLKFRRNTDVDLDPVRAWCPMPECETVVNLPISKLEGPQCATCPSCTAVFCAACSEPWHPSQPCHSDTAETLAVPNDEMIKRCPSCRVPIERDEGCAQMLCKKCKHVFCWYCLTSLDDDFLLRHYDKGPCKNKLGHSRASILWHRAQVIGIFAGFGLLLVVASPLLCSWVLVFCAASASPAPSMTSKTTACTAYEIGLMATVPVDDDEGDGLPRHKEKSRGLPVARSTKRGRT